VDTGFLEPAYGARSLTDVLPSVGHAIGARVLAWSAAPALTLPEAPSYVVFLVDGLGADLLAAHAHAAPYLSSLLTPEAIGTAGVPSTTATSLTSLGTGLVPGAHGVVGFTSRVPGSDRLLNALFWDKAIDPLQWQPHPTGFQLLAAAGVHVTTVNKREFRGSGLTLAAQRGGEWVNARPRRRARRGCRDGRGRGAVAHLPVRRRPGLDGSSVRRRVLAVAPAAGDHRRRGRAAP
jgi:hypothetical protein